MPGCVTPDWHSDPPPAVRLPVDLRAAQPQDEEEEAEEEEEEEEEKEDEEEEEEAPPPQQPMAVSASVAPKVAFHLLAAAGG